MKNKVKILFVLLLLTSCGGNQTSNSINTSNDSSTSETTTSTNQNVSLNLKNIVDGDVKDATFKVNDQEITSRYQDNTYYLDNVPLNSILEINHPRYQSKKIKVDSYSLSTLSMDYPFMEIGKTRYNSNYLYNDWTLSSTRSLTSIRFELSSNYDNFISSKSVAHLFINTGTTISNLDKNDYEFKLTSSKLFVYDYGFNYSSIDLNQFNYTSNVEEGKTTLYLDVPYEFLKIDSHDIVGVTLVDDLLEADITSNLIFDEDDIDYNNPTKYPRIDVKGRAFKNTKNVDNPFWISKKQYASLIEGKDYMFASPKYNRYPSICDDVHFSIEYKESLSFDFVGFGEFIDSEYFQIVLHNNIIDKNSWQLVNDDVVLQIFKDKVCIYNECDEFFSVQNGKGKLLETISLNSFINYGPYFTLKVDIPIEKIPNIRSSYDDIYLMAVEFNNKTLYDGVNYYENFFYKNVTRGDPADMISYVCIDAPEKRTCNLTNEEKQNLIKDKKISFASPEDTKFSKADDVYLSITRNTSSLLLDMVGFGDFSETEIFTFVFHSSSNNGESWKIQNDDTTLMVSQKEAKLVTNTTDFWVGTRITRGTKSNATVNYTRYDDYFTLSLEVSNSEISSSLTQTSLLKMYAFEFGFGGVLYNSEPWTKLMRYQGVSCGDPAFQVNYIEI